MSIRENNPRAAFPDARSQILRSAREVRNINRDLEEILVVSLEGDAAAARAAIRAGGESFAKYIGYRHLLRRVREIVRDALPSRATVAVISKGDDDLLNLCGRRAWHFPQTEGGTYAGHYPGNDASAVDHLEELRVRGAEFLLIPSTARWWLEHYAEFGRHLESHYRRVVDNESCIIYHLSGITSAHANLKELQRNWDELGKIDPLWAILTDPKKVNRKWSRREFFRTGEEEISGVMRYIDSLHIPLARRKALDFGCGVGRLTQALCRYFDQVCGVDIAPSMINLALKYNRYGSRCRYHLNVSDDLRLFGDDDFDFIYSSIVLQHIRPEYCERYVREFLRVLAPNGILIFQIPSELNSAMLRRLPGQSAIAEPLPAAAFRAKISVRQSAIIAHPASQVTIRAKVKNSSGITWPALGDASGRYRIWLGNNWLDESGNLLVRDDGRTGLPKDLGPMEEVTLPLVFHAPREPGDYILEFDMVQEGVAWFKEKGSETKGVRVKVKGARGRPGNGPRSVDSDLLIPKMDMYGVPKDVVLRWIASGGGTVIDVQEDGRALPHWFGFRYCVTKK
jgi:SAM-dependent methyltransferase